jgi:hypothetical protein
MVSEQHNRLLTRQEQANIRLSDSLNRIFGPVRRVNVAGGAIPFAEFRGIRSLRADLAQGTTRIRRSILCHSESYAGLNRPTVEYSL